MDEINIALEVFGIAVTLILLVCCFVDKANRNKQTLLFTLMLVVNILVLGSDIFTYIYDKPEYEGWLYFFNTLVYALGYVLTALFTSYLISTISIKKSNANILISLISILCFVAIILVLVSLFNHMYFSFDGGEYVRGPLYMMSQVYPILILFADMIIVVSHSKSLGLRDTLSLLSYSVLPIIAMLIQIRVYGITLLYLATTLSLLIIYVIVYLGQSRKMQQQKLELEQAKISIMLSQIQPHFLFNSLSSIAELCENQEAREALVSFSKYLRVNIDSLKQKAPLPFETELQHIKTYLYLEKLRFKDRLNIVYNIRTYDFFVPSLTIQPIVENSVKYGVGQKEEGGTVTLSTWEENDCYKIKVEDDGVGFNPYETQSDGRMHIGIDNVKNRLAAMCKGTMTIDSKKGEGTIVVITIPKGENHENISGR